VKLVGLPRNYLQDQMDIWTSPARFRWQDARWFVPLAVGTGLLIGSDHHSELAAIRLGPDPAHQASQVADGTLIGLGAIPALLWLNSTFNYSPHGRETGYLSAEALADSLTVSEVAKFALNRNRPGEYDDNGRFFQGNNSSFPSNHAVAAWSVASVLGQEYPGVWSRLGVYSAATAVSLARVAGEQHFPSDVLVGSALGYLVGHYVYRARHDDSRTSEFQSADPAPSGPDARDVQRVQYTPGTSLQDSAAHIATDPPPPLYKPRADDIEPDRRGSVYVPMDSWIYPALDRLAGLGFVPSQNAGLRPWTREECLRQLDEAEGQVEQLLNDHEQGRWSQSAAHEAQRLIANLRPEFAHENDAYESLQLDSVYARATTIAGAPLTRSFDLGQTLDNDYGRPFTEGTNSISGAAISATSGRFSFYVRDEAQHAPGAPNFSANTLAYLNLGTVQLPPPLGVNFADIFRNRPIEMYAGVELGGWEFQFGKQELYWGPTQDAPLSWSVNAEPTYNFQIVTTRPHQLPGILDSLGTYRIDLGLGKLSGHTSPARPWYNGQKITFNLGNNVEIGFTRWSVFAGEGTPLTLNTFLHNIFSFSSDQTGADPGDRKSGFDFRWHLPRMQWITLYSDSYADDEPSPLDSPRRSAWDPGIYLSRIPGLPHLDLRFEVASTELFSSDHGSEFLYTNDHYIDANLNKGYFVGNSVGRDGRRYEGWTTWWFNGRDNVQLGYRQTQRSDQLLPGSATQSDALLRSTVALPHNFSANLFAQYERYNEPVLKPGPQRDLTGQFELKWEPKLRVQR
jgi:hypothetical protein